MSIAIPPNIDETEHGVIGSEKIDYNVCKELIRLSKHIQPIVGSVQKKGTNETGKVLDIRNVIAYRIHEEMDWVAQLLKYKAPSIGYGWHTDMGNGDASTRKLGLSISLNDDYEGGEFMVFGNGEQQIALGKGEAIVFSSFLPHKVKPITKGERWSLVAWVSGSCFR